MKAENNNNNNEKWTSSWQSMHNSSWHVCQDCKVEFFVGDHDGSPIPRCYDCARSNYYGTK